MGPLNIVFIFKFWHSFFFTKYTCNNCKKYHRYCLIYIMAPLDICFDVKVLSMTHILVKDPHKICNFFPE